MSARAARAQPGSQRPHRLRVCKIQAWINLFGLLKLAARDAEVAGPGGKLSRNEMRLGATWMIHQHLVDHLLCLIEMAGPCLVVYLLQCCIAVGVNRRGKRNARG